MSNRDASSAMSDDPTHAGGDLADISGMKPAETIRTLRKERNLSQSALAAAIGWERGTIAAIEAGHDRPGAELIEALATFFQVSTDRILGREGAHQPAAAQTDAEAELLARFRDASPSAQSAILATIREITRSKQ
jgi:transcriptional regulator with XRE-family HTH domain